MVGYPWGVLHKDVNYLNIAVYCNRKKCGRFIEPNSIPVRYIHLGFVLFFFLYILVRWISLLYPTCKPIYDLFVVGCWSG